jgi:hypothetical protein
MPDQSIPVTRSERVALGVELNVQAQPHASGRPPAYGFFSAENRTFRPPVTQKQKSILNFKKG